MDTGRDALAGLRILIVEDEFLVAMLVEEMLQNLRCEIVGPVSTLEEAVATVRQNRLDGALLDVNLNGKSSFPVADELLGHEVPFILVTGYGGHKGDPPLLKRAPRVNLARLILPPPEQSCVEGQLQAIFAGPQGPLRLLALDCHAHPANAGTRSKMPTGQTAAGPPH